ncbi:MAG: Hsp20/alpha crystallin family protein [Minisyncoccia bacterium]
MEIIKWDPFKDLERFFSEEFFPALVPTFSLQHLPVDIYETDKELIVEVGVPGMKKDDIKIRIEEDRLIVEGKKSEEKEVKEKNYYRKEIRKGEFRRVIALPYEVDPEKGKAKLEDGVLKVVFPKPEIKKEGKEVKIE